MIESLDDFVSQNTSKVRALHVKGPTVPLMEIDEWCRNNDYGWLSIPDLYGRVGLKGIKEIRDEIIDLDEEKPKTKRTIFEENAFVSREFLCNSFVATLRDPDMQKFVTYTQPFVYSGEPFEIYFLHGLKNHKDMIPFEDESLDELFFSNYLRGTKSVSSDIEISLVAHGRTGPRKRRVAHLVGIFAGRNLLTETGLTHDQLFGVNSSTYILDSLEAGINSSIISAGALGADLCVMPLKIGSGRGKYGIGNSDKSSFEIYPVHLTKKDFFENDGYYVIPVAPRSKDLL